MKKSCLFLAGLLGLSGCATTPLGRSQFIMLSDSDVAAMGNQSFVEMKRQLPVEESRSTNAYVLCVADTLTREVGGTWEVVVFRDDQPNAFALPGGKIGVHTGILRVAKDQDQLATVLAHEIAHVLSHHSNERVSQQMAVKQGLNVIQAAASPTSPTGQTLMGLLGVGAQYGVLLPYSRLQESEADLLGLDLMAKAGFDPGQSVNLWVNMEQAGSGQPVEFLSTHPSHETRMEELRKRIPAAEKLREQAQARGLRPQCDALKEQAPVN